jgi:hypothetical protein
MSDIDADLALLASHRDRWHLEHPLGGVHDWTIVCWPLALVRRASDGVVVEAETLAGVIEKAADWFRENG